MFTGIIEELGTVVAIDELGDSARLAIRGATVTSESLEERVASGLEQLRGIGVSMSEKLLAERAKQPFADWADLIARVPGVSPSSRFARRWRPKKAVW